MRGHSFKTICFSLTTRGYGKQFVYKVDDGKKAVIKATERRPFQLPRTPRNYQWRPGEEVIYVQPTAAGWMLTSIVGTLIGFVFNGGKKRAVVIWHSETKIAPTISLQRLRPASLFHGHNTLY
jgi:hypothetical protein